MALQLSPKQRSFTLPAGLRPLARKNFGVLWIGALLSSIGFWIQVVGQGWQVLQLTNSALLLGLVTFASTIPSLVLSFFCGVLADRFDRRLVLILTQGFSLLAALVPGMLTSLRIITVWDIIAVAVVNGILGTINLPAWQAFIGDLLPPEELRQGIALNSTQFNLSRVIGPVIAGFSIGIFGIAGVYYLNALSYLAPLIALFLMGPIARRYTQQSQQSLLHGIREGLAYVLARPTLQLIFLQLFVVAFLVFPYLTFMPIFADSVLHSGSIGLGILNAGAGAGALIGSITLVVLSQSKRNALNRMIMMCIFASIACIAFATSRNLELSLFLLLLLGATTVIASTTSSTMVQVMVPEAMCGRVLSIWMFIVFGLAPLGNLTEGLLAQTSGAPLTLTLAAALCMLLTLLIGGFRLLQHVRSL